MPPGGCLGSIPNYGCRKNVFLPGNLNDPQIRTASAHGNSLATQSFKLASTHSRQLLECLSIEFTINWGSSAGPAKARQVVFVARPCCVVREIREPDASLTGVSPVDAWVFAGIATKSSEPLIAGEAPRARIIPRILLSLRQ